MDDAFMKELLGDDDDGGGIARVNSATSDLDDFFPFDAEEKDKKINIKVKRDEVSKTMDREYENLFDDSDPKAKQKFAEKTLSLESLDDFVFDMPSGNQKKTKEVTTPPTVDDEFLTWLHESPVKESNSAMGSENGSESDKKTGAIRASVMEKLSAGAAAPPVNNSQADDDDDEVLFSITPEGNVHLGSVEETTAPTQEAEQVSEKPVPTLPVPKFESMSEEVFQAENGTPRALKNVIENAAPIDAQTLTRVTDRITTLFDIQTFDRKTLLAAISVNEHQVVPPSLRSRVWGIFMGVNTTETPNWFEEATEPSTDEAMQLRIAHDAALAWGHLGGDAALQPDLIQLVSRLVMRNLSHRYNILLTNLASVILFVCANGRTTGLTDDQARAELVLEAATLTDGLLKFWGSKFDWSIRDARFALDRYEGIGGAAFASNCTKLIASQRHTRVRKLLLFHDPVLALHLEANSSIWIQSLYDDDQVDNLDPRERLLAICNQTNTKLNAWFGQLGPLCAQDTTSCLPIDIMLRYWDAIILNMLTPQLFATCLPVAYMLGQREKLLNLKGTDLDALIVNVIKDPSSQLHDVAFSTLLYLCGRRFSSVNAVLNEAELPLEVVSKQHATLFLLHHVQQREKEKEIMEGYNVAAAAAEEAKSDGWLSNSFLKKAQELKTTLAVKAGVHENLANYFVRRRLVEFAGEADEDLGLMLAQGKYGLTIQDIVPGSIADRTNLAHKGDILISLNGVLMLELGVSSAKALMAHQSRPMFLLIGTVFPKEKEDELIETVGEDYPLNGLIIERVSRYYKVHNPEKCKESSAITGIYHMHEDIWFSELTLKYFDHVEGDPYHKFSSHYALVRDPRSLLSALFRLGNSGMSEKVFVVDCRPQQVVRSTGKFPTSFHLDPAEIVDPKTWEQVKNQCNVLKAETEICIMCDGSDIMLADLNMEQATQQREYQRRAVDTCVCWFVRLGFPHVSVVEGGFLGCYREIQRLRLPIENCLVGIGDQQVLHGYDEFLKYRTLRPAAAATFISSKAKATARTAAHTDTNFRQKASALFSNVLTTKKDPQQRTVESAKEPPGSPKATSEKPKMSWTGSLSSKLLTRKMSNKTSEGSKKDIDDHEAPSTGATENADTTGESTSAPTTNTDSLSSIENEEHASVSDMSEKPTTESPKQSYWGSGWLKSINVSGSTSNFGSKLKTTMSQAYTSAQQKLNAVTTEIQSRAANNSDDSRLPDRESESDEVLAYVASLESGATVRHADLGSLHTSVFDVEKEKRNEKLNRPMFAKRTIVITQKYLLVLEPHTVRESTGHLKSKHALDDVMRLRYANDDIHLLTLVFRKGDKEVSRCYRFPYRDSKDFTKTVSNACMYYNQERDDALKDSDDEEDEHDDDDEEDDDDDLGF